LRQPLISCGLTIVSLRDVGKCWKSTSVLFYMIHRSEAVRASLPMYNLPEMRSANAAFWAALRQEAGRLGLTGLPERLDDNRPAVPPALERDLIFSQVCGYPLQTIFRGQAILLGVPSYAVKGCEGPTHVGIFIVHRQAPYRTLRDLAGCRFVFNSIDSNSGMNLSRRTIAELAGGRPFFGSVVETGGHPASLDRIVAGEADATCVDCVTYAFCCDYRNAVREHTRILAATHPSPAIPFVTSAATPLDVVATLRAALVRLGSEPEHAGIRTRLKLHAITPPNEPAYPRLLELEREAAALGYPRLE
jgi:ABC-type phosphate/phosphonate transport system substrate-binding protein